MYPRVVFDLDGTLLDTLPDIQWALNSALTAFGLPTHDRDSVRRMVGHGLSELVSKAIHAHEPASLTTDRLIHEVQAKLRHIYREYPWRETRPYPGIPELLAQLKAQGIQLGVLTNKAQPVAELVVDHFFPGIFQIVSGESPDRPRKPDPKPLHDIILALDRQAGTPAGSSLDMLLASSVMVGDSDVDIKTALNAACPSIAVTWGFRSSQELTQAGARSFAADSTELSALLGL